MMSYTTFMFMTFSTKTIYPLKMLVQFGIFLKFKFWIVETKSDGEMTKTKVVDLDYFLNFVYDDVSIWLHL